MTPRPVAQRHPRRAEETEDFFRGVPGIGIDAADVREYARNHPDGSGNEAETHRRGQAKRKDESEGQRPSKMVRLPPAEGECRGQVQDPGGENLVDDSAVVEPARRTGSDLDRPGSPTAGRLFAPHFAGGVGYVGEVDEEAWEEKLATT